VPEASQVEGDEEPYRGASRRDYARLIHSAAFRRLQGKTQLFPNHESDFFRNRLTHSLEVAQIAKSIANRLNSTEAFFQEYPIDTDLVETAALAHDLGHPPFGHNGEEALDKCMALYGGFEGNAQTLRILSKLEKKRTVGDAYKTVDDGGKDMRAGLNLTARTLAAILKYDSEIARERKGRKDGEVDKGYYYTERDLVSFIKENVIGNRDIHKKKFKTLECSIMDVADDIAYSTYDIEDALKGGFTNPIEMISATPKCLADVASTVEKRLNIFYSDLPAAERKFTATDARDVFIRNFSQIFDLSLDEVDKIASTVPKTKEFISSDNLKAFIVAAAQDSSRQVANVGYRRTQFTSDLVGKFIRGVEFFENPDCPPLSYIRLKVSLFKEVETFKVFAYESLINSARLKLAEFSGKSIITTIFERLNNDERGFMLLPEDFRAFRGKLSEPHEKARVVCDFVAGMTDRYAMEFYSRLTAPDKSTVWKPL
jgi:dGTPase